MSNTPTPVKLAIGIPTINQWDRLKNFLKLYVNDFPGTKIFVWDNGNQNCDLIHPDISYHGNRTNIGVAAAWNQLCQMIFSSGHTHACILNDDVYWAQKKELVENFIQERQHKFSFFKSLHDDWCVFVISKIAYHKTGKFDEAFYPAYYEDRDYMYRMKLGNVPVYETPMLVPMIFNNSQSIAKDPSLRDNFDVNKARYAAKWGGLPGKETFKFSFNGKAEQQTINK